MVEAKFWHTGEEVTGKVVWVEKRYGLINDGTLQPAPLLTIVTKEGEEKVFDNSFVTAVIEKAKGFRHTNIFQEFLKEDPGLSKRLSVASQKGVLCGTLQSLTIPFLAQMYISLERPIDDKKLAELFGKQKPGLVKYDFGIYWVNKKAFGKWVRRNALRICATVVQLRTEETRSNKAFEDDYYDSLYTELEESLNALEESDLESIQSEPSDWPNNIEY